jgi:hypothetical protein
LDVDHISENRSHSDILFRARNFVASLSHGQIEVSAWKNCVPLRMAVQTLVHAGVSHDAQSMSGSSGQVAGNTQHWPGGFCSH